MNCCRHCKRPYKWMQRGLCKTCVGNPDVFRLYKCLPVGGAREKPYPDETAAELDALVAAQYPTMPTLDNEPAVYRGVDIAPTVLRGRGVQSSGAKLRPSRRNW